ncbi:MAG: TolC family protein [Pirellulales bacterium]|nr:TolC family protein [Pirellulales bacterium]
MLNGCTRTEYRQSADKQTYQILKAKSQDPRWRIPRMDITPDPTSRFYDVNDPDTPPLPPDDPAAKEYMERVYGMKGSPTWDQLHKIDHVENPNWPKAFGGGVYTGEISEIPETKLTIEDAVSIGLRNSRDYQEQMENMYLAALALTFERYRYDVRPIAFGNEPGTGIHYENTPNDGSNWGLGQTNLGVSKLFPTGAQFMTELTNNTIWMLSGNSGSQTATTLAYSLVQPLAFDVQRTINLEKITQQERNVLYKIRDFARFRKDFYVTVVTGSRALPLPGSSGSGELAFLIRGARSPTVGFYYLLYEIQRLRNQKTTIRSLESLIRDLEALGEAGRATSLDVTELQSSLERGHLYMAHRERVVKTEMDRFKMQLGLPPDLNISLDDSLLRQFEFLDNELLELEYSSTTVQIDNDKQTLVTAMEDIESVLTTLEAKVQSFEDEIVELEQILPIRFARMTEEEIAEVEHNVANDKQQFSDIQQKTIDMRASISKLRDEIQAAEDTADVIPAVRELRRGLLHTVRALTGVSIAIRLEKSILVPLNVNFNEAASIALENRLDLMNRRGIVVDTRRRYEVAAERLLTDVNLVAEGSVGTPPLASSNEPFDFSSDSAQFRAGIEIVTPLDRRRARNNFRAAQVSLQRARRNYMAAEDQVKLDIRTMYNEAITEARIFEICRRALRVAARELDQAIEFGDRPDAGEYAGGRGVNISRALENILYNQNEMIESWAEYETARLSIYRDMGTMDINESGLWADDIVNLKAR